MKKLFVFTLVVSLVTLAGFWGGRQVCRMTSGMGSTCFPSCNPAGSILSQDPEWKALDTEFQDKTRALCMKICKERAALLEQIKIASEPTPEISARIEKIGQLQIDLEKQVAAHIFEAKKRMPPKNAKSFIRHLESQIRQIKV